jgi:hypothetical protein
MASPKFSSFKQYEKSSAGAATLDKSEFTPIDPLLKELIGAPKYGKSYDRYNTSEGTKEAFEAIMQGAKAGDKNALDLLKILKQQKSDYAEGKLLEPFELNSDNVVGAIFNPGKNKPLTKAQQELQEMFESRGIEAGNTPALLGQKALERRKAVAEFQARRTGAPEYASTYFRDSINSANAAEEIFQRMLHPSKLLD